MQGKFNKTAAVTSGAQTFVICAWRATDSTPPWPCILLHPTASHCILHACTKPSLGPYKPPCPVTYSTIRIHLRQQINRENGRYAMVVWYLKRKDSLWTSLLESMLHFLPLFWGPPALWHPFGSWRPYVFLQSFLKQRFTNRLEMLAHLFVVAMRHACFQRQAWPSAAAKSRNGSRIIIH